MNTPETYYTIAQVAKMLYVEPQTVRNYIRKGKMMAIKTTRGEQIVYKVSKVEYLKYVEKYLRNF